MTGAWLRREDGFTLLEMLIAVSLMALIGIYLSSAISSGRRVWEMHDRIEDASSVVTVRDFLRRQLQQVWPAFELTETGEHRLVFSGQPYRIEFVSPMSDGTNWSGLYRIGIYKETDTDRAAIRIVGDLFRPNGAGSAAAFDRNLLDSIESLEFSYFGSPNPLDEAAWYDQWNAEFGLPRLIRVRVRLPPDSPLDWPDIIVGLELGSS